MGDRSVAGAAADWWYFRRLYEALLDHDDGIDGRRAYLSGQQLVASDHLAELESLRKRERVPAGGYNEQSWPIMKVYALSSSPPSG